MAANEGTWVIAGITTPDSQDVFATHFAKLGKGGWRTVADITERNNITTDRREVGMVVWVSSNNTAYQLRSGITNSDWYELPIGGGNSIQIENFTITPPILSTKQVILALPPTIPEVTILTPLGGIQQEYGVDFSITGNILSWNGLGLDGYFVINDKFSVIYK
jgi:hypothetical protein